MVCGGFRGGKGLAGRADAVVLTEERRGFDCGCRIALRSLAYRRKLDGEAGWVCKAVSGCVR